MTKAELITDMKRSCGDSGFITRTQLKCYFGNSCPKSVDKYLQGLDRIDGKYYFVGDVAASIMNFRGVK